MDLGMKDSTKAVIQVMVFSMLGGLFLVAGWMAAVDGWLAFQDLPARGTVEGAVFEYQYGDQYDNAKTQFRWGIALILAGLASLIFSAAGAVQHTIHKLNERGSQADSRPQQQARQNQGAAGRDGRRR